MGSFEGNAYTSTALNELQKSKQSSMRLTIDLEIEAKGKSRQSGMTGGQTVSQMSMNKSNGFGH